MTQPPQPLQIPQPEPLDESERALAQVLRSLPVGAPPPELDARILGAARRAVHLAPPRKRDRRWLVGLGTAASALLAIGVILKTHGPDREAMLAPSPAAKIETPAPVSAPASVPEATAAAPPPQMRVPVAAPTAAADTIAPAGNAAPVAAEAQARMKDQSAGEPGVASLDKSDALAAKKVPSAFPAEESRQRAAVPMPPTMAMPAAPEPIVMREAAPMAASAPATAPAPPPPPPAPAVEQADAEKLQFSAAPREASAQSDVPLTGAVSSYTTNNAKQSAAASKAAPASPDVSSPTLSGTSQPENLMSSGGSSEAFTPPSGARNLDRVEVTGRQVKQATSDDEGLDENVARGALPAIAEDTKLSSAQWIKRIHARVKAADGQGARESLRRYRVRYPEAAIPDDLQPLQQ
jgi:hypothetical protein